MPMPIRRRCFFPCFRITARLTAVVVAGALAGYGCGPKPKGMPDLAPVTGTVTLDGRPLTDASVAFVSEAGGHAAFGGVDASGRYELHYSGRHNGAGIGPNTVRISTRTDHPVGPEWKDPIPAKYNLKSELKAEVKPGPNTIDFELKSK